MKRFFAAACIFISFSLFGQTDEKGISIIPEPVSIARQAGSFILPRNLVIEADPQPGLDWPVAFLKNRLTISTGISISVSRSPAPAVIRLLINKTADPVIGKEGYQLTVSGKEIIIRANEPAGVFYGIQSLLQLFPKEIEGDSVVTKTPWTAPCVQITDYPRFQWRGLMFDVSRHFFTKDEVKKYIDDMVRYKFNLLHLHLTDDEGWRIEIKSLPALTKVGAFNVRKVGNFGDFSAPGPDEPRDYGGFYTQEDIKELVKYAKDRFVDILPEIDVPGHSLAAIASYPELSCTTGADAYHVRSGEEIMDWSKGGTPVALIDNTLCPANEKVYAFLDKVLTEVAALFPFEYIHMGGDECPKNFWEKSPAVKALMQKEGLRTEEEVQSYFEKRLEKIVASKGKKFMGWDEILEGGLAPSAAVMSWRGMQGGAAAAKMKHKVVMSPDSYVYLDYMQGDAAIEPPVYASIRLNRAYDFEPVPDSVDPAYIIGGQANLWTEQVYNIRHAEYMTWPRGMAVAERLWSPKEKKDWNTFAGKMDAQFSRLDLAHIKYAPSIYDPVITVIPEYGHIRVALNTEISGLTIYYSFDNSYPDSDYPKYTAPLVPPVDATMLRMITYKGNMPVGRMMTVSISDLKQRVNRK